MKGMTTEQLNLVLSDTLSHLPVMVRERLGTINVNIIDVKYDSYNKCVVLIIENPTVVLHEKKWGKGEK